VKWVLCILFLKFKWIKNSSKFNNLINTGTT